MKKNKLLTLGFLSVFTIFCFTAIPSLTTHAAEDPGTEAISNLDGGSDAVSDVSVLDSAESTEVQESQSAVVQDSTSATSENLPIVDEPNESEDDIDKATLQGIIENLKAQLEKYKDIVENDTLKAIINALITFLTAFGALWLKFRSFDKAKLSLNDSQTILKVASTEIGNLTKDIANLAKKVSDSESTNNGLVSLFGKSIETISTSILRLTDRLEDLEEQVKLTNKEGK